MSESLRADIAAAAEHMGSSIGAGHEMKNLADQLAEGERVVAMVAGDHHGNGVLVLTDRRVCFYFDGIIRHEFLDFPLDQLGTVDWDPGRNLGHLTIGGAEPVVVKAVDRDGGDYFAAQVRAVIPPTA